MKKMKKIVSIMLALVMVFSMCGAVFGANGDRTDGCTIRIDNSAGGKYYFAYKIFDATYATVTEDIGGEEVTTPTGAVSYTIDAESPWLEYMLSNEGKQYFTLQAVYAAGYDAESDPEGEHISYYAVQKVKDADDAELVEWLSGLITVVDYETGEATLKNGETIEAADGSAAGNGGAVTISGLDSGYYFVTTSNGSVVSITTAAPDAEIIDKNQAPGDLDKSIINSNGEKMDAIEDGMDEDVNFDITAFVPMYDGTNIVTDYIFTDSLSNGLLIELTANDYNRIFDTGGAHYYLNQTLAEQWITLVNSDKQYWAAEQDDENYPVADGYVYKGTINQAVYNLTVELLGYDTYTDKTTGNTVHTFTGFVLTYDTYNKDQFDGDYAAALDAWIEDGNSADDFDFDAESYFEDSVYPRDAYIEIQYTAHVSSLEGFDNTNDIVMNWHVTAWSHPTPNEPEDGNKDGGMTDHNDVYSWELELVKIDGDGTETPLEGAEFTLYSEKMQSVVVGHSYAYVLVSELDDAAANGGTITVGEGNDAVEYEVVDFETTDYYKLKDGSFTVTAPTVETIERYDENFGPYHRILTDKTTTVTESTHLAQGTTDSSGKLYFGGLGAGDYVLTEITSPDGYNLLSEPIEFSITWSKEEGFKCYVETNGISADMKDSYVLTMTVKNNQGIELPGTGGIGTTIFYVIGFIVVAGAAVLLVTRRRINRAA